MRGADVQFLLPKPTCCSFLICPVICDSVMHRPHVPAQAVKGEACTENKSKKRARCTHTLAVAVFSRIGLDSTASSAGGGGAAAGASSDGSVLPRTPQVLLNQDPEAYASKMTDMLTYLQRSALPSSRPSGLERLSENPARRLKVSQRKCTCGGELLLEADVDGTLVTEVRCGFGLGCCSGVVTFMGRGRRLSGWQEKISWTRSCRSNCYSSLDDVSLAAVDGRLYASQVPQIVKVKVECRKCRACGASAWASDNWRETSVFNYNNYTLVELSLLYKCLAQFIRGTTIQSFFFAHLEPLTTDIGWLTENPALAERYVEIWDC